MNPVSRQTEALPVAAFRRVPGTAWKTLSVRAANSETLCLTLRAVVFGVLLVRAGSEPLLNLSGGGESASAMGLGAAFNALVIVIAGLLLVRKPLTAPFAVVAIWGPFLLIIFAATLYAPDFVAAARLALVLLSYWALFATPFFIWQSQLDTTRFILIVMASSIAPSLYACVDIARGLSDLEDFRLQSTFAHPNIYAFYLVLLIGLSLYIRSSKIIRVTPQIRLLVTLYAPVLATFLMFTKTRSAWVACVLMFTIYAIRIDRRFLAGFLLIPVLVAGNPSVLDRLTDITEATEVESFKQLNETVKLNSYAWRQALWESAMPPILDQPILGHGLESFRPSTPSFFPLVGPAGIDGHNLYLQVAFEMGLIGLLALAWLLAAVAIRIASAYRRDPPGVLIILSILGGYILEAFSDNMHFYLSFNWYFWFVMGTIYVWASHDEQRPRPKRLR